jgi:hypothetical protein
MSAPESHQFVSLCKHGLDYYVKLALDLGIDIHYNDDEALMEALKNHHLSTVKLLIDTGEFVDYAKYLNVALSYVLRESRDLCVINYLIFDLDAISQCNTQEVDIPFLFFFLNLPLILYSN